MISEKKAKYYCCEEISLIENYELAIADTTQTWECHHRAEVLDGRKMFSKDELLKLDLYLNRPAKELIFLTQSEHMKIHGKIGGKIGGKKNAESGWIASLGKKSAKSILQYTKAGKFIKEWESAEDVHRQTGINNGNISSCCTGRYKSAGGFVWKFKKSIQHLDATNDISTIVNVN